MTVNTPKNYICRTIAHTKVTLGTLDTAQQLTVDSVKVRWTMIYSKTHPFMLGTSSVKQSTDVGITYPAGTYVIFDWVNLNQIYFVDSDGANKPILQILYILDE